MSTSRVARSPLDAGVDGTTTGDGASEGEAGNDAATDAFVPACDPTKPFGAPITVGGLDGVVALALSPDELTAYVAYNRGGGGAYFDLHVATRANTSASFGAQLAIIGAPLSIESVWVSADGLRAYGSAVFLPGAPTAERIYRATRADGGATTPFSGVTYFVPNGTSTYDFFASLTADELEIFIERSDSPTYHAARSNTASAFPDPTPLTGVTGSAPAISPDGLHLFTHTGTVVSERVRPSRLADFGAAQPVTAVNTAGGGTPAWVSADGCRLYLLMAQGGKVGVAARAK